MKELSIGKLIPNLHNKTRYILHYKNLKLYLDLGMKFNEGSSRFDLPAIALVERLYWLQHGKNVKKRLNNVKFAKTMKKFAQQSEHKTDKRLRKLNKAPAFDHFRIAGVILKKTTLYMVYLNRLIYAQAFQTHDSRNRSNINDLCTRIVP